MDWENMTTPEIMAELRRGEAVLKTRGIIQTGNKPISGYAEHLFCKAFGWKQEPNSNRGYDATDEFRTRFEVKARQINGTPSSRQLSGFRDLPGKHFDMLAAVLFNSRGGVERAILLPHALVTKFARYQAHTNSHILLLKDELWSCPEAKDVTAELRAAALS